MKDEAPFLLYTTSKEKNTGSFSEVILCRIPCIKLLNLSSFHNLLYDRDEEMETQLRGVSLTFHSRSLQRNEIQQTLFHIFRAKCNE